MIAERDWRDVLREATSRRGCKVRVARALGVNYATIWNWEAGRTVPEPELQQKLVALLGPMSFTPPKRGQPADLVDGGLALLSLAQAKLDELTGQKVTFTLDEIGDAVGLCSERVRQIEEMALLKLAHGLAKRYLGELLDNGATMAQVLALKPNPTYTDRASLRRKLENAR